MIDSGGKKIQVKGEKRRTDGDKTRIRRRSDGEKNMNDIIVHIWFKGCWLRHCLRFSGHVLDVLLHLYTLHSTPYTSPLYTLHPTLYTLHSPLYTKYSRIFLSKVSRISCWTVLQRSRPAMPPPRSAKKELRDLSRNCMICCTSRE